MTLTKELQFAARVSSQPGLGTFCSVCALCKGCGTPWVCVVTISEIPTVCAHSKNNLAPVDRAGERNRNFS